MSNQSEQRGTGRRDLLTGGTVATALAAIAGLNLPIAFLRQPQHLVPDGADIVRRAQAMRPDDYSDFWASGYTAGARPPDAVPRGSPRAGGGDSPPRGPGPPHHARQQLAARRADGPQAQTKNKPADAIRGAFHYGVRRRKRLGSTSATRI